MAPDLEVLLTLPQDRAIVSTKGFCRIVEARSGETFEEMVPLAEAHLAVASSFGTLKLAAVDYASGERLRFDDRLLSPHRRRRWQQLIDAPRYTQGDKARRCFMLGRLLPSS